MLNCQFWKPSVLTLTFFFLTSRIFACLLTVLFCPSYPTTKRPRVQSRACFDDLLRLLDPPLHSDRSVITDAVQLFFFFHFSSLRAKIDRDFWACSSAMLEITLQCFPLMYNANALSAAMLTPCLLFIPTRGVAFRNAVVETSGEIKSPVSFPLKRKPRRVEPQPSHRFHVIELHLLARAAASRQVLLLSPPLAPSFCLSSERSLSLMSSQDSRCTEGFKVIALRASSSHCSLACGIIIPANNYSLP